MEIDPSSEEFAEMLRNQQMNDAYRWNRLMSFLFDLDNEGEEQFMVTFGEGILKIEATSREDCITINLD